MGTKGKRKTRNKKAAKKAMRKKGIKHPRLKDATKLARKSEQTGLDPDALLGSAISSVPLVGGFAEELRQQAGLTIPSGGQGGSSGRGGVRGVQLIDSKLGNIGTISRKKALAILVNRNRRPPRRSSKTVAVLRAGESVQVVK